MDEPIGSASELWEFFIDRAGLEPDGWDAQLVVDLRVALALKASPADLGAQLKAHATSVEDLLVALLDALEPFGAMLADLLELFARSGVSSSGDTVAIEFDFEQDTGPLRFELDAFRRARAVLRRTQVDAAVRTWTAETLWRLPSALPRPASGARIQASVLTPDAARWLREYREGGWPLRPLEAPRSGHAVLDERLESVWKVWRWLLAQARALAPDRGVLAERWRTQRNATGNDETPEDPLLELVGLVESDYWLEGVAERAFELADRVRAEGADSPLAATAVAQIDAALPSAREERQLRERLIEQLEDLLDLPFWKRRHELFSAWVLTRILDALAPAEIELRHDNGVLRFAFSATRLAAARLAGQVVSVWSEVRSPLIDPLGASRRGSIQPDYSLLPGEADAFEPEQSVLEVECKQYKRAATRPFAEALADYARGRSNAEVVLVDHGPVDAQRVLARPELRAVAPRTHVIGDFRPGRERPLHHFATLARGALWSQVASAPPAPKPAQRAGGLSPMVVRVAWSPAPQDVELHLFVDGPDGRLHVHRDAAGNLVAAPFARHETACAPAPEQIRIERQRGITYDVVVRVGEHAPHGGAVELELSWERQTATLASGWINAGSWWHAYRVQPRGTVSFVDKVSAVPPAGAEPARMAPAGS